jgi:pyruvate dehydrogenase E2 component (dihydrolipoamide acetyltransferase)
MAIPVIMPKLEMSQETSTVVEWLKQEGETVVKGEPLLTIETDKVTIDIESPGSGILVGVRVGPQEVVPVTDIIAYILQPGEELPQEAGPGAVSPPSESAIVPTTSATTEAEAATPVAQRLAAAHSVDLSAVVGTGAGGRVTKADVELVLSAPQPRPEQAPPGKVRATPAARRFARERGIDLATVAGSGPQGRIQAADVAAFVPIPAGEAPSAEVVPLTGIRHTIAARMTASSQTIPHITLTLRVDMNNLEEMRTRLNSKAEAEGLPRVSVTVLLVKAVAWALKRNRFLNSTLKDEEIHLLPEVNVGVAVALEEGLIVPVLRQADRKSVSELSAEVSDLTIRAREGRLTPSDVAGGTFTISNLGPFGIEQFTAIINPPQAGILAVGTTQPEVVVDGEGQIAVRPMIRVTLSADHRIVDGAVAARFLADLREALEAPTLLLW